ncbi:MAG: TIGR03619 family F420-dependent LLM class oxidoreductase [Sphingomonadaceae bacterium]
MDIGLSVRAGDTGFTDIGLLTELAQALEAHGFASMWVPEHVVFFSEYRSKYPYHPEGKPPFGNDIGLFDPLLVFAALAQKTERLRFATSVMVLPERPALLTAKEVMTLDHLSRGRYELGVGAGWSEEEYAALGVSFARRGKRFDEYIRAIRAAWHEDDAAFSGEFVSFEKVVLRPRPYTPGGPPFLIGGDSEAAMRRAATLGDGWYSWWRGHDLEPHIETFRRVMAEHGRSFDGYRLKIGTPHRDEPAEALQAKIERVRKVGATEMVLAVPIDPRHLERDIAFWAAAAGVSPPSARPAPGA